jgi:hypothetical protein
MSPTFRRDLLDFDHFHTKAIVLVLFLFHSAFQQLKVVSAYSGTRCLLLLTLQANHSTTVTGSGIVQTVLPLSTSKLAFTRLQAS